MNIYSWFPHVSEKPDEITFLSLFLNENFDSHVILSMREERRDWGETGPIPRHDKKEKQIKVFAVLKLINTTKHGNLFISKLNLFMK